jgi:hypothetical protein
MLLGIKAPSSGILTTVKNMFQVLQFIACYVINFETIKNFRNSVLNTKNSAVRLQC